MRGKERRNHGTNVCGGITPAYAGKSGCCHHLVIFVEDHPRVCGEKGSLTRVCLVELGSPPRMRGKGWVVAVAVAFLGITPAYAGKSAAKEFACKDGRDHPRVCGEKVCVHPVPVCALGSPPRMRGKVIRSWIMRIWTRITPAYAGKSSSTLENRVFSWDHPRVCGEKCCVGFAHGHRLGSPPRMRGKAFRIFIFLRYARITPAYAGKRG